MSVEVDTDDEATHNKGWQLNVLSNSQELWVTSLLTVEEWCVESAKWRRLDLEDLVLVRSDK